MSVLAVDIGSSRIKALLAHWDGRLVELREAATPRRTTEPGELAYPADRVQAVIEELIGGLAAEQREDPVDTLVFSCLGTAMVPLDAAGQPLGPALAPADTRPMRGPTVAESTGLGADELFERTGSDPAMASFLLHALWWQRQHPRVADRLARYRSLRGYALEQLCGADVEDRAWASRTMLVDLDSCDWSTTILDAAGLSRDQFPPLADPTETFVLRPSVAERLTLAPGAVAVVGAMDNCCSLFGADGPGRSGVVNIVGTYEHMAAAAGLVEVREVSRATGAVIHGYLLPDRYITMTRVPLGPLLERAAAGAGASLDELLEGIGAGAPEPAFALDRATVDAARTAGVAPAVIVRALVEAGTEVLRRFVEAWARLGLPSSPIVAVGGGARHEAVLQRKADLLGRPVVTLQSDQAAGVGALRLAAMARRGLDAPAACRLFGNAIARTFEPRPAAPNRLPQEVRRA